MIRIQGKLVEIGGEPPVVRIQTGRRHEDSTVARITREMVPQFLIYTATSVLADVDQETCELTVVKVETPIEEE